MPANAAPAGDLSLVGTLMAAHQAGDPLSRLALQQRITLVDASRAYLVGRPGVAERAAERPIYIDDTVVAYLAVARALRPSDALVAQLLVEQAERLLLIVALGIALSAAAAVLLAAHFRKPIRRLAEGARELTDGRFETRLDIRRTDELGELAHSFNALAARLEGVEQSRRQWVADTSHELRTPLSVLRAQVEAIEDGVRPASPDNIAVLGRQVAALGKLVEDLYVLARADVGQLDYDKGEVDLWQLAVAQAAAFADKLHGAGLALEFGPAPAGACVHADPDRLRQVLDNLLENCVRYTDAGGRVRLSLHAYGAGHLALAIDDSAPGVTGQALARLGERFYRAEASHTRGGSGLGLALCRQIALAHGATLAFSHSPLGGLRVVLDIERGAAGATPGGSP